MHQVERSSNKWLYTLAGIYIAKDEPDRHWGRSNFPNSTLPPINIYNDKLDRAPEPKDKNSGTVENGENTDKPDASHTGLGGARRYSMDKDTIWYESEWPRVHKRH